MHLPVCHSHLHLISNKWQHSQSLILDIFPPGAVEEEPEIYEEHNNRSCHIHIYLFDIPSVYRHDVSAGNRLGNY